MLTLKKVKELVNAPVHTKRVPSPKVLLEEGRIFLRKEFEHGSHSLGSKFLDKQVKGYYSNDSLEYGPFKMLVNCGENCFFTLNIAKKMIPSVILKNVIAGIGFLIVAYVGIRDNLIAIPILQILLSALFFTEMIHHFNFIAKLSQIYERIQELFRNKVKKDTMLQEAVLIFLDYETTLAYNKAPLSDSVYKAENKRLTEEWEEIKRRYEIL